MTHFYDLIYILAHSESYTVAQKLSHRNVYLSINFYNYGYRKTFKTQNSDYFKQSTIGALMQRQFKIQSTADHFRH